MINNPNAPSWNDAAHSAIKLRVTIAGYSGEFDFIASPADSEAHGRDLFARAVAGEFGPIAAYVPPVKTPEEEVRELTAAVQRHLDAKAQERGYDGILSLCSYATSTDPTFAAEGQAGVNWRDAVWRHCYGVLAAVTAGTRAVPTAADLIAELPAMVWP